MEDNETRVPQSAVPMGAPAMLGVGSSPPGEDGLRPEHDVLFHFCPDSVPPNADCSIDRLSMFAALGGEEIYDALAAHQQPEPRRRVSG